MTGRYEDPDATVILPVTDPDATMVLPVLGNERVTAGPPAYRPSHAAPEGPETTLPAATDDGGSMVRNSAVMALGSVVSRVTGFGRTAVIGMALGAATVGNTYTTAQFFPGMVYELLLGGILASVIVPLLVRARKSDADGGDAYAQRLLTLGVLSLGVSTLIAVACAPLLTIVLAAQDATPKTRGLLTTLGYLILPTIFFFGMAALIAAVLNTRGHFAAPMWTPILNNVVVIAVGGLFIVLWGRGELTPETISGPQIALIGGGTMLGIVVQAVGLLPALRKVGFRWRWRFDFRALRLREIFHLGGWMLCYVAVSQVSVLVILRLASEADLRHGAGALIYNNGFLLMAMAHGIVAVSIITALMPRMSAAAADNRLRDLAGDLNRGTRLSAVVLAPIAVIYAVLAEPIAVVLFNYGRFTHAQAVANGVVIAVSALALLPYSISQLQIFAFYALPDTRTPALVNIPVILVRVGVDLLVFLLLPATVVAAGLTFGNAISFVVAAVITAALLRRRLGPLGLRQLIGTFVRIAAAAVAAAAAGLAVWFVLRAATHHSPGKLANMLLLVVGAGVIGGVYFAVAHALRIREVSDVVAMVRRKLGR